MDLSQHNMIVNFIWSIADDCLRDVYVRGKYRDVILPMIVIRRIDALLETTKAGVLKLKDQLDKAKVANQHPALCQAAGQAFYNTSPFLLRDLKARTSQQKLKADFESYLDGFSPNVQEILEKFKFRNQIDMDSYRVQVMETEKIRLADEDAEIEPILAEGGGRKPEPELDRLSNIIKAFNDQFGNIDWKDADKIQKVITEELPVKVSADKAYQNAIKQNDRQNARIEHDKALERVIVEMLTDHTELFKQFMDNQSFRKWLTDTIFTETYKRI
jgi:type I restriction enzyme, R subunit